MAYVSKSQPTETLLEAIRRAAEGERSISQAIAARLLEPKEGADALSDRELEVLVLLAGGKQTNAIAKALFISPSTVSTHLRNIKEKLQLDTVAELVGYAFRNDLLQ